LTLSSSSQGRLEQIVAERDAAIKNYEKKIASLSENSDKHLADADTLRTRLTNMETMLLEKDKKLNEMDSSLTEQYR